jgi:hypothetical protein
MIKMECDACGKDCSNAYATYRGAPYHFSCIPMRNQLQAQRSKGVRLGDQQPANPIFQDKEAIKALQTLKDKGYSSEDVIQKLWEMERGI